MAVEVPLSPEELQYWIDRWIVVYEHEHHRTLKTTPIRVITSYSIHYTKLYEAS